MVLSSNDVAAEPLVHARLHAEVVLRSNVAPTPLPHRCPGGYMESANQPGNQISSDMANQSASLTKVHVNVELAAVRGGITRAQP